MKAEFFLLSVFVVVKGAGDLNYSTIHLLLGFFIKSKKKIITKTKGQIFSR